MINRGHDRRKIHYCRITGFIGQSRVTQDVIPSSIVNLLTIKDKHANGVKSGCVKELLSLALWGNMWLSLKVALLQLSQLLCSAFANINLNLLCCCYFQVAFWRVLVSLILLDVDHFAQHFLRHFFFFFGWFWSYLGVKYNDTSVNNSNNNDDDDKNNSNRKLL